MSLALFMFYMCVVQAHVLLIQPYKPYIFFGLLTHPHSNSRFVMLLQTLCLINFFVLRKSLNIFNDQYIANESFIDKRPARLV